MADFPLQTNGLSVFLSIVLHESPTQIHPLLRRPFALCDSDKEGEETSLMVLTSSKYSSKSRAQHLLLFIAFYVFFTKKPRVASAEVCLLSQYGLLLYGEERKTVKKSAKE